MRDTKSITVHLSNPSHSKVIHTDLTDDLRSILSREGFEWFEAIKGPVELSMGAFQEVEAMIDKNPY